VALTVIHVLLRGIEELEPGLSLGSGRTERAAAKWLEPRQLELFGSSGQGASTA